MMRCHGLIDLCLHACEFDARTWKNENEVITNNLPIHSKEKFKAFFIVPILHTLGIGRYRKRTEEKREAKSSRDYQRRSNIKMKSGIEDIEDISSKKRNQKVP